MKVAIIGAGFTGLAAGVTLVDAGHKVTIYESEDKPGGLAVGFKAAGWNWTLEKYYHHIFTGDRDIIEMANKVGQKIIWKVPETNTYINGRETELDSPISLLKFKELSMWARIHMGAGLLALKLIPNGKFLERFLIVDSLPIIIGREGYKKIWEPLLIAKFDKYADEVNLAWFWARVYKRTQRLGYFEGGFQELADKMTDYIREKGGEFVFNFRIADLSSLKSYKKILLTIPGPLSEEIMSKKKEKQIKTKYLNAQTLVLELDRSFMKGYWLNILDREFPFLVAVEHTNFMQKNNYGNKTIIYLGNYLTDEDPRLKLNKNELIKKYLPYLTKINHNFKKDWIVNSYLFSSTYAQPVFSVNYSKKIQPLMTKIPGVYLANMGMVYPWDRGTNYAVALGASSVKILMQS